MPNQPSEFRLSNEKRDRLFVEIGKMLKQKVVLQQALREQKEQASSFSEDIFLELLEVVDALQFLLDYMAENSNPSTEFISNIPNSLAAVQKKFLSVLAKRQLHQLEITGTQPDFSICKVIDCEVRNDLEESTITKVVRRGFRFGDKIIRPIEVITSKKDLAAEVPSAVSTEEIIQDTPEINNQDLAVVSPAEVILDTPEIANQDLAVVSPAEVVQDNTEINNDNSPKLSPEEVIQEIHKIANQDLAVVSPAEVVQDNTEINNDNLPELSPEEIIQEIQEIANQDLSDLSDEEIIQEIQEIQEIAQAMPETGEDSQASDA